MKLLLCTLLLLAAPAFAQHATIHIPESPNPLSITLSSPAQPWGFHVLTIRSNGHVVAFHPRNPPGCAPANAEDRRHDLDWSPVQGMALDASLCFYRGEYKAAGARHTILLFRGYGWASNAAASFVIGFRADGTPFKVVDLEYFDPIALAPTSGDSALLIGAPSLSEVMYGDGGDGSKAPYATTYDPRAAYIIHPDEPARYDLAASKAYNQQHYSWIGPHSREDYAVVYNFPGHTKAFSIPAKQLDALFAKLPAEKKPQ